MRDVVRWPLDYFLKTHTAPDELYVQVRLAILVEMYALVYVHNHHRRPETTDRRQRGPLQLGPAREDELPAQELQGHVREPRVAARCVVSLSGRCRVCRAAYDSTYNILINSQHLQS